MLRQFSTKKFRGLGDFTMEGLGRVNLLVGANNCGKTTVLEALNILLNPDDPWTLVSTLARRGEDVRSPKTSRFREVDISHLFETHEIDVGSTFEMSGENDINRVKFRAKIVSVLIQASLFDTRPSNEMMMRPERFSIVLRWNEGEALPIRLTEANGLDLDSVPSRTARRLSNRGDNSHVEFITTGALNVQDTVARLEEVALTENEDLIIRALRHIEPDLERIVPLGSNVRNRDLGERGGVAVKLAGVKTRVPLGSLGDGMWRMLGIALSLARAQGGYLLIDEIDTGLHYTVMDEMWRLIYETAKKLDIQVFAATHSRDCYQSLASIVQAEKDSHSEVTIQRLERGNPTAVAFTDDEITRAAECGMELR